MDNNLRSRIKDASHKLGLLTRLLTQEGKGQSLIVIVFAFLGLLAFVGLAVDLGLVYIERVQLGRACDAAALAAAQELPFENDAAARALEYLALNGYDTYDPTTVRVEVNYCSNVDVSGPAADDAETVIKIDTTSYEDTALPPDDWCDSSSRIKVEGSQRVGMNFMQFFGFDSVAVSGEAVAENINDLDIAIVFDKSGSMEFDTLCYGCWTPIGGSDYPTGTRPFLGFPYNWEDYDPGGDWPPDVPEDNICNTTDYYFEDSYKYIVIEAEHYSYNHSIWDRDYAVLGLAHWTLQRNTQADSYDYSGAVNSSSPETDGSSSSDGHGGYMKATPYYYSTYEHGATSFSGEHGIQANTPRLDYDFHTPSGTGGGSGNYYIFLRAQGGRSQTGDVDPRVVHWGLNGSPQGSETVDYYGIGYDGARGDRWTWNRIGPVYLTGGHDYELNLWVGGLGFCLDKIIITRDSNCTSYGHACRNNSYKGPDQTRGRTEDACDPCDPRYVGKEGCYNTGDDLWDDEQPVRAAKEAVKRFVGRLNPEFDQVSYVHYSSPNTTDTAIGSHLYCQKKLGDACQNFDAVLDAIEGTQAGGNTSMGDGMRLGTYTLSTGFTLAECQSGDPCGRPRAAHIMIVMTDGVANDYMSYHYNSARDSYGHAAFDALWPDGGGAKDYVIYQAVQARDNGIVIYAISLGVTADFAIMQEVADITNGEHFYAPDTDQLDYIFDTIFERIFLRLIS
jgi:hypothetical protein